MVEDHTSRAPRGRLHYTVDERRRWMRVLARSSSEQLHEHFLDLRPRPVYDVDHVETRIVGHRGIASSDAGGGRPLRVTHCVVRLPSGITGKACLPGGEREHAELAAVFDALLKEPERYDELIDTVIEAIEYEAIFPVVESPPAAGQSLPLT